MNGHHKSHQQQNVTGDIQAVLTKFNQQQPQRHPTKIFECAAVVVFEKLGSLRRRVHPPHMTHQYVFDVLIKSEEAAVTKYLRTAYDFLVGEHFVRHAKLTNQLDGTVMKRVCCKRTKLLHQFWVYHFFKRNFNVIS